MKKLLLVLLLGMICGELYGQDVRARLESERKQLQQEIVQINGMLQKNKNTFFGIFGANMSVSIVNEGPITFMFSINKD